LTMHTVSTRRKSLRQGRLTLGVLGLAVILFLSVTQQAGAASCGPGPHWVDTCPSGADLFPSIAQHGVVIFDSGLVVPLPLMLGPTEIFRGPGTTTPDHHIDTEMVSLNLSAGGLTLRAGDGIANLNCDGPLCTFGRLTETGDPAVAHSFFDV